MKPGPFIFILLLATLAACAGPTQGVSFIPLTQSASQAVTPSVQPQAIVVSSAPVISDKPAAWIALLGDDGNLSLLNPLSGERKLITQDGANPMVFTGASGSYTFYSPPAWSSDGSLLAYQASINTPASDHVDVTYALWVYDLSSEKPRLVLENERAIGFSWQPGSHQIAYGQMVDQNYFISRGEHDPARARGILGLDVDNGTKVELVKPERGYSLLNPVWSSNGRTLGFDEVLYMEGKGAFAYYDFQENQYHAWDKVIGAYDWSPDGQQIVYDGVSYNLNGTERIMVNNLQGGDERNFSPAAGPQAFGPRYSPQGDLLAYQAAQDDATGEQFSLVIQPTTGGPARSLGIFPRLNSLDWSPDGQQILIATGANEKSQIKLISLSSGAVRELGDGSFAVWQP